MPPADKARRLEYQKTRYQRDGRAMRAKAKSNYIKKREDPAYRTHIKRVRMQHQNNNPEKTLLAEARRSAGKRNLDFDLVLSDILVPEYCPAFPNIKLEWVMDNHADCKPSVDRIDSSKGYTSGNIQIISWLANNIKSSHAGTDLLMVAKWMIENSQ